MTSHDEQPPEDPKAPLSKLGPNATALCLSGGGYRAMLFHVGTLWRLNESGMLPKLDLISSVSGGSITAGCLAKNWNDLAFDRDGVATLFKQKLVEPIRKVARTTIDIWAVLGGLLLPKVTVGDRVAANYRKLLFGGATLQDLPDAPAPIFVINATNVQSGALWRFSKHDMRDYRVGQVCRPTVPLARAVAASSAFPPFLSPLILDLDPASFTPKSGDDLQVEPYTSRVVLCDGGVYDNLGLETAWKRCKTILVSDAGAKMAPDPSPKGDWFNQLWRVFYIEDDQVRNLRKRDLMSAYTSKPPRLGGTYWGIRTDITEYPVTDPFNCPLARTTELAAVPTRLAYLDARTQERLINWGYAVCDAALRSYVDNSLVKPQFMPYPQTGV